MPSGSNSLINKIVRFLLIDRIRYTNKTYYNIQAELAKGYFELFIASYTDDAKSIQNLLYALIDLEEILDKSEKYKYQ